MQYIYMNNSKKLKRFLDVIQDAGVPQKLTNQVLQGLGFKSNNDRPLLTIMKAFGFVSSSGVPTPRWQEYRDKSKARAALAEGIREHYSELFKLYPDAHQRDNEALRNFFSTHTKVASATLELMVRTFKTAVSLADFDAPLLKTPPAAKEKTTKPLTALVPKVEKEVHSSVGHSININIQLTIPATDDPKIYDSFFAAMKKHLLETKDD